MDSLLEKIFEWIRQGLIESIMESFTGMFDTINQRVGEIAGQVGQTPEAFNSGVFSMVRTLSETAVLPIAGMILTFVMCYELITMLTEKNNMHDFDTFNLYKWVFKTFVAVYILTHTFDIVMGVFELAQSVVNSSSGIISGSLEVGAGAALDTMRAELEAMGVWELSAVLLLAPALEQQRNLDRQAELLASISSGGSIIVPEEPPVTEEVDFYEVSGIPAEEAAVATTPQTEEPAPDAVAITGTGILTIDRIEAVLPVTDGVTEEQLAVAVGHVPQTAPIGGEGNAVLAGHRSYTYGRFFNRLGEIAAGDLISYKDQNGAAFTYEVFETLVIEPGDQTAFVQPEGERLLTLYTCTPVRTATHRLLVRARLLDQITTVEEESH